MVILFLLFKIKHEAAELLFFKRRPRAERSRGNRAAQVASLSCGFPCPSFRSRAKRAQLKTFKGLLPERQGMKGKAFPRSRGNRAAQVAT